MTIKKPLSLVFSLALIIIFFIPWFVPLANNVFSVKNLTPSSFNVSGFEVHRYNIALASMGKGGALSNILKSKTPPAFYLAYFIPLLAGLTFVSNLMGKGKTLTALLAGAIPVSGYGWLVFEFGGKVVKYMTFGSYFVLMASLGLIVVSLMPGGKKK